MSCKTCACNVDSIQYDPDVIATDDDYKSDDDGQEEEEEEVGGTAGK